MKTLSRAVTNKSSSLRRHIFLLVVVISLPRPYTAAAPEAKTSSSVHSPARLTEDPAFPHSPALERARVRTATRVWKEFIKNPKNGVDLVYDCILAYPDASQVLSSLAEEAKVPVERVRETLGPLAVNLVLSYTKIFGAARSPRLLRRYVADTRAFYEEKGIPEKEYTMLNGIIDQHIRAKVGTIFTEDESRAPWEVLEAVKKAIFRDQQESPVGHRDLPDSLLTTPAADGNAPP